MLLAVHVRATLTGSCLCSAITFISRETTKILGMITTGIVKIRTESGRQNMDYCLLGRRSLILRKTLSRGGTPRIAGRCVHQISEETHESALNCFDGLLLYWVCMCSAEVWKCQRISSHLRTL